MILVAVLAISLVVIGCAGGEEEEEEEEERTTITLDFGTFWSATDFQVAQGEELWMQTISSRVLSETTDYRVVWTKVYSKHPSKDLWPGVVAGTYDVITSGPGYAAGTMTLWEGTEFGTSGLCRKNALTMSMAIKAVYENVPELQAQVLATGVVPMYWWSVGPGYFLMVEGHNVTVLEDFAGPPKERIRAATPGSNATIAALGGEPKYMPMSSALEAFQAGLIDGILCPTDTPKGFGLGGYVRNGTFAPFSYGFVFMNVMNAATWNSLPTSVKNIFTSTNAKWTEYNGKLRTWGEYDGKMYCLGYPGVYGGIPGFVIYDLPTANATEYNRWVTACASLVPNWVGSNATRQAVINNLTYWDNYYCNTEPWKSWDHSWPTPPPLPTFP
jgi:hypothetical protein